MATSRFEKFDDTIKPEGRTGDVPASQVSLVSAGLLTVVSWAVILFNDPSSAGWFALHPPLQTLAVLLFTYGIITLQPTSQPKTKVAGLLRHQVAVFLLGFPSIVIGTSAISYNKWLRGADHFVTWHGFIGIICMAWIVIQVVLGAGSVWFGGALFGGGMKAKNLWKYHRVSGYLLFPTLLFTIHLGGAWSNWGSKYIIWIVRFVTYTLAPAGVLLGVLARVRTWKMPIF
ncbi:hypothetical protein CVT24_009381 [Panaeolus cyanescens]|uniref:Cytochrome b561 domain-containing protein n=1 Tax=Panaeolus cyanescens TaxID=181874 RepID=A0A409VER8_9AGAR|nr:hypothetical protein CVT24_009381 [Panaeolus cyanescens]